MDYIYPEQDITIDRELECGDCYQIAEVEVTGWVDKLGNAGGLWVCESCGAKHEWVGSY